jgi:hypothetical protein
MERLGMLKFEPPFESAAQFLSLEYFSREGLDSLTHAVGEFLTGPF